MAATGNVRAVARDPLVQSVWDELAAGAAQYQPTADRVMETLEPLFGDFVGSLGDSRRPMKDIDAWVDAMSPLAVEMDHLKTGLPTAMAGGYAEAEIRDMITHVNTAAAAMIHLKFRDSVAALHPLRDALNSLLAST